tara:strand:+ start:1205 stop:1816 length:612 start_codon:yes stop_codon:yes gene_type:complete
MLRKVKLYGELAKIVGHKELEAKVDNISQSIRFLTSNFPKVERYIANTNFKVLVGDYQISEKELEDPIGKQDLHFVPVITGAGGEGGLGRILTGAALIGVGVLSGGTGFALNTTQGFGFFGGGLAATAGNIGVALALTGVSQMLAPTPKTPDFSSEEDPRLSFNFSGTQNTSRAGTPVPIVYGEIFTGSVVISAGVDTEQVRA